jgi:hypothetical protein
LKFYKETSGELKILDLKLQNAERTFKECQGYFGEKMES